MSLYKYLPPERIDVLEKLQIRFSPAISTNDIFELKPLTKGWASKETAQGYLTDKIETFFLNADTPERMLQIATAKHPEAVGEFRKAMKILGSDRWLQMMKDGVARNMDRTVENAHEAVEQNWESISNNFLQLIGTQLGILSLSEDPRSPVMWGHYADSSRGFVIQFDNDHPWFHQKRTADDDFCHLRKVTYVKDNCPKFFSELTTQDIGYSKLDEWSYEKEWRMLFPLARGINNNLLDRFGQPVILFQYPAECVTEIIIGSRATEEFANELFRLCENFPSHVIPSRAVW